MFLKIIIVLCVRTLYYVSASGIFDEKAKVLFTPDMEAEYFGYSVILNPHGLIVGAPKSKNNNMISKNAVGQIFNCSLANLDFKTSSCSVLPSKKALGRGVPNNFYRDDMWLGASIASMADDKILICAPRSTAKFNERELFAHGGCFVWSPQRDVVLATLSDNNRQIFPADGSRPVYDIILEFSRYLYFFANGQAGMSIKIISNETFIIGAPGLLQWTGGVISYHLEGRNFKRDIVTNTYYTKDLGPDEYFGYSVESGVFQRGGKTLIVGGAPRSSNGYGQVLIINQHTDKWYSDKDPLDVVASIRGPQLGAYFGASLCCVDIDGDGVSDLLVGAPNYVNKDGDLPFDQGTVFVYLTKQTAKSFGMELSGEVTGSGASGARFGTAISGLGDVDGDGFNDVAIAAPWENDGAGAVYIYRGTSEGLQKRYTQRLVAEGTRSFGIALSNAMDVDNNNCNDEVNVTKTKTAQLTPNIVENISTMVSVNYDVLHQEFTPAEPEAHRRGVGFCRLISAVLITHLAIGAAKSSSVFLYRCVPTIKVYAVIEAPNVLNLPSNVTSFNATFCAAVDPQPLWPFVQADLIRKIEIDPDEKRAYISEVAESRIVLSPYLYLCRNMSIHIEPTADLGKPISIDLYFIPDEKLKSDFTAFNPEAARVSEESVLHSSHLIQLTRVCGDNKFCTPWLVMTLTAFDDPYIPGASDRLGAKLSIQNIAKEPAYGAKVIITLPASPKRLPSSCTIEDQDLVTMTCDLPAPLAQNEEISWDIDLEYKYSQDSELKIVAEIFDSFSRNITDETSKELTIEVAPVTTFNVIGKPLPNDTIIVPRKSVNLGVSKVYDSEYVPFTHHFEITNFGPSDWFSLDVQITLPEMVTLASPIKDCETNSTVMLCNWYMPAKTTKIVDLPLHLNLHRFGDVLLEKTVLNVTTEIVLDAVNGNTTAETTTTFLLDEELLIWPFIVGALAGVILLGVLVYIMYRMGFFSRPKRQGFNDLAEQTQPEPSPTTSPPVESPPNHRDDDLIEIN